jgi:hypothetical protein
MQQSRESVVAGVRPVGDVNLLERAWHEAAPGRDRALVPRVAEGCLADASTHDHTPDRGPLVTERLCANFEILVWNRPRLVRERVLGIVNVVNRVDVQAALTLYLVLGVPAFLATLKCAHASLDLYERLARMCERRKSEAATSSGARHPRQDDGMPR